MVLFHFHRYLRFVPFHGIHISISFVLYTALLFLSISKIVKHDRQFFKGVLAVSTMSIF